MSLLVAGLIIFVVVILWGVYMTLALIKADASPQYFFGSKDQDTGSADTASVNVRGGSQLRWWCALLPWRARLGEILVAVNQIKQAELDIQTRYKILTDNVAAAVVLHRIDGTVLWCSPYTEVLTGYAVSEISQESEPFLSAHIHEDDHEFLNHALEIVRTGEPYHYRYRFYHKSGLLLWLETRTVPILGESLENGWALSVTLDVTGSVNAQHKIEERNRDLNEFTYMLSHDLKAPIITLRGMLEIIRDESKSLAMNGLAEPLEYMAKAIYRLEQLVGGVLELARVSAIEKPVEPVNLLEVVREVIDDYHMQIAGVGASVSVIGDLPWVFGTKTQLYQIFSNLIGNALKYRRPERYLRVTIQNDTPSVRRRALISVRDNGRGIAPEQREAIFTPFNRGGETMIDGSGIGLSCVKRLVEKIGGAITVDEEPEGGSAFIIDLRRSMVP